MKKSFDILIVGAGTAGMACAIEAAQRGLSVGIVEKSDHIGGAMHWSGGHMSGGGTALQKRKGIDDSPEDHYKDILRISKGTGDLKLIQKAVQEAPKTIDWLDEHGFEFAPEAPRIIYGHVAYTKPRTQYGIDKAKSILKVMQTMWDSLKGNIECFLEHPVLGIDQVNGKWTRIVCSTYEGQLVLTGDYLVITTGGYGSNPDYFRAKHPDTPLMSSTYPTATGDGHKMLEENKGMFRMADLHLPSLGGMELEPGTGRCNFNEAWAMVMTSIYRRPRDIYVNLDGHRFMNEDETDADIRERHVTKQKSWRFWVIFDEEGLMAKDENGNENPIVIGWTIEQIKKEAQRGKCIFKAHSIEGLAESTKLPYETLSRTIANFNRYVDQGEDPDFNREHLEYKLSTAPYYAILVYASVLVSFGGIAVNSDLQILDTDGQVQTGIYGAGELLGLGALSGNAFCSGMAITPALSFGRILGQSLGK